MLLRSRRPIIVRVAEYERVILPPKFDNANVKERLRLAAVKAGKPAFDIRNGQLVAKGVVGVIDIGPVAVELLPKTNNNSPSEGSRRLLVNLLRFASDENEMVALSAFVGDDTHSLLEAVLSWCVGLASRNIVDGLPTRYVPIIEQSTAVRGRIDLNYAARARPGKELELIIRHAPLSIDNTLSRIIRWLVSWVMQITQNNSTRLRCQSLVRDCLKDVAEIVPTEADFRKIQLQTLEERWELLLQFAHAIIQQRQPNPTHAGAFQSISVLFTLHDLFESALRKIFNQGLRANGIVLKRTSAHLLTPIPIGARNSLLALKPDFRFIQIQSGSIAIGDAKWKRLLTSSGSLELSEQDAYQVAAYLVAFRGQAGFLFCPLFESEQSLAYSSWLITGLEKPLHVIAVDIAHLVNQGPEATLLRSSFCKLVSELYT
jgi:5-methylcytosine-specific restriction endonuclease McrBC regulatory subunit McrC